MKLARGVPVDTEGFPIFKTVSQGRALLPAPWKSEDTDAPKKTHYEMITKAILDTNAGTKHWHYLEKVLSSSFSRVF